jgi:hypothetical protein
VSKRIPPSRASKRGVLGGRAGRSPGTGTGRSTNTPGKSGLGNKPSKGWGSKKLGGRPPKFPGGGFGGGDLPI